MKMAVRTIWEAKESRCPKCGRKGIKLVGVFNEWYNVSGQPYNDVVLELVMKGENVIEGCFFQGGCSKCGKVTETWFGDLKRYEKYKVV